MGEIWRPVREFPGHYEVSNFGQVRRTKAYHGLYAGGIRKPQKFGKYLGLILAVENAVYARNIHRLVADAFLGPIPDGMQVNHKSGDKHDNRLENLEIITNAENRAHAYRVLGVKPNRAVETNANAKLTWATADAIREEYKAGGMSHPKLAAKYGVNRMTILRLLNNRAWKEEDRPSTP